ncbi:6,7-dimethyl-8-ribityllumazine synthase [Legionella jordanis]|uniref:6,7-dimethyl-8-ribityllumazine synthase n=1 Tax=Legionella jordanis TaxID=456 RepID=A0A0W0V9Z8_9GAMM|nr:6,7-dimethyl-8-ribityllumazine synthase [Legionella jordanis]KTD16958.1 riboflavin synthase beta chain (6,7-dimethyl-8-ribityllumazine synthase) [Legionella jordanis]RMX03101.1 6,7-dimethyl-8-ribityllumazine synthase [Legionella jordanis]RMX18760.1 6,7-dimethyl-8-ribityllumazine synthase [Legionella jordanis]VEH12848.1 riboflavin synthase subunit beta [Legionella jordanis]HAT8713009.1 6,7-dimethyl-8-ribityllumazine synthase [Legionella jordanis]
MKHIKVDGNQEQCSFPVAIVVSRFNQEVTKELQRGAVERLNERGFRQEDICIIEVPGAVEIPLIAQRLAKSKQVKAIIALGAVIRGETSHYDYVCEQVSNGCQRVSLDYDIPVVFGILTTDNDAQAWDRLGGNHGHKGRDAADCAIEMQHILENLERVLSQ